MVSEPLEFTGERAIPGATPERVMQDHIQRYRFASRFVHGGLVLDLACGTGYGVEILYHAGAKRVVGADLSRETLSYALAQFRNVGTSFLACQGERLGFRTATFDAVVSFETLEHLEAPDDFLGEINRVLRHDGVFICSTPNRLITTNSSDSCAVSTPFHHREFATIEFIELLRRHGFIVALYGQRMIPAVLARPGLRRRIIPRISQWLGGGLEFRIFFIGLGSRVGFLWPGFTARYLVAVCRRV